MDEELRTELLIIQDSYSEDTRIFVKFLDEKGLDITPESLGMFYNYLKGEGYAANTINKRIAGAKNRLLLLFKQSDRALNVLNAFKFNNEIKKIKKVKLNTKSIGSDKVLSFDELKSLIESGLLDNKKKLFIRFLASTGARVSEMLSILNIHVSEHGKDYFLIRIIGKGNKERMLRVGSSLIYEIRKEFKGKKYLFERSGIPYTRQYISKVINRSGYLVLNKNISAHTMRHTFATLQIQKNRKLKALSTYLGHATTAITQDMYVHEELDFDDLDMGI